jgi:dTDP-4-amino-4,6-dideoxygalactose transaminase
MIVAMVKKLLPYTRQSINADDIKAVGKALKEDIITRGPVVEEFEKIVADYCGAEFAVAFNSGTTALEAAAFAAKIEPVDRVITTPNTFVGTVAGAIKRGAKPVFVDIEAQTGNIDLDQLELTINRPSTRGKEVIIPVHFSGIAVDVKRLSLMIKKTDTVIIEDAAHALGSVYPGGEKVGCSKWSDMTVFSFHPAKHITTGEGGMVLTNDPKYRKRLLLYRNNGIVPGGEADEPWMYRVEEITGNYNFTDMQAALGVSQFKRLDEFIEKRRQIVNAYRSELKEINNIELVPEEYDSRTSYHIFVAKINFEALGASRAEVMNHLMEKGVGAQVHYIPLYRHPFMKGKDLSDFPNMEEYYSKALTLPLFSKMEEKDVSKVALALKKI